jgi:hypothetical protein
VTNQSFRCDSSNEIWGWSAKKHAISLQNGVKKLYVKEFEYWQKKGLLNLQRQV